MLIHTATDRPAMENVVANIQSMNPKTVILIITKIENTIENVSVQKKYIKQ